MPKLDDGRGFFEFDNPNGAKLTKRLAVTRNATKNHAAVDATFVQFYLDTAWSIQSKGTLSAVYLY
jgi:hypothetical protein